MRGGGGGRVGVRRGAPTPGSVDTTAAAAAAAAEAEAEARPALR